MFSLSYKRQFCYLAAGDNLALFVASVAVLRRECHTWRAIGGRMTIVRYGMIAEMSPLAWFFTSGFLRTAWNWGIDNTRSAFAVELFERATIAG